MRPLKNDLTGQRFGRLVVIERTQPCEKKGVYWHCRCDCGKETDVLSENLLFGATRSCGCYRSDRQREMRSIVPPVGAVYGRLTVYGYDGPYALCRCSCGQEKRVMRKHLLDGSTRSCGCLRKEHIMALNHNKKHS